MEKQSKVQDDGEASASDEPSVKVAEAADTINVKDSPPSVNDEAEMYPPQHFPRAGSLEEVVAGVPAEHLEEERRIWRKSLEALTKKHRELHKLARVDIKKMVIFCKPHYAEMAHDYEKQRAYWQFKPMDLASMAHSQEFSTLDINWTQQFLEPFIHVMKGERILDLCGGMARCSSIYANRYHKVDVLDLKPRYGELAEEKKGNLITGNLRDVGRLVKEATYDTIIANWSLCYLGYQDLEKVLKALRVALSGKGFLLLKEPVLLEDDNVPWLCPSGQWQHIRPCHVYTELIEELFIVEKT